MLRNFDTIIFSETLKRGLRNFSGLRDQNLRRKNVIPLFWSIKLFETRKFLNSSRIALQNFSTLRHKNFGWKSWYAPSYPYIFFDTRKFPENRRVPLQRFSFRSCETKNSDKTVMTPPMHEIFRLKKFLKHQSVLQWKISVPWDKKFSTENRDNPPPPPPHLLSIFFSLPESFWNTEWFPGEVFSILWVKKTSTKPWSFPPPLLANFGYQNSFETQKCSPTKFIVTETKSF